MQMSPKGHHLGAEARAGTRLLASTRIRVRTLVPWGRQSDWGFTGSVPALARKRIQSFAGCRSGDRNSVVKHNLRWLPTSNSQVRWNCVRPLLCRLPRVESTRETWAIAISIAIAGARKRRRARPRQLFGPLIASRLPDPRAARRAPVLFQNSNLRILSGEYGR